MAVVEKGSLILITGVTGFIASHTADQALQAGYLVRGTARSQEKAQWLSDLFDKKYGKDKFSVAVVPDMVAENAFDEAVKDIDGIMHMASVMTFSDKPDEVIPIAVKGATNVLDSAVKEPKVKSVVLTSSSTSVLSPEPGKVIKATRDMWNDKAIADAEAGGADGFVVYSASKTQAEKAFWEAVGKSKGAFQASAVLPNCNFGPIIKPGGENESSTGSIPIKVFNGDESQLGFTPQWFVDVRDTARLHIAGLIDPSCNGERIFAFSEPFNMNDVLAALRKQNPGKTFPDDKKDLDRDLSQIPTERAEELLQKHYSKGFTSLEDSVKDCTATVR